MTARRRSRCAACADARSVCYNCAWGGPTRTTPAMILDDENGSAEWPSTRPDDNAFTIDP